MLKRLRAKHPIGFCVLSEVLFLGSLLLASYLIVFALVLFGVDLERVDSYFLSAVQEAVGMVVAMDCSPSRGPTSLMRTLGAMLGTSGHRGGVGRAQQLVELTADFCFDAILEGTEQEAELGRHVELLCVHQQGAGDA